MVPMASALKKSCTSAQSNNARNANSQAKRKRIVSLLFVVVDAMQIRFRNLRVHAGVHRKLNTPRYFSIDDRTRLQDLRGLIPRPRFAISASLSLHSVFLRMKVTCHAPLRSSCDGMEYSQSPDHCRGAAVPARPGVSGHVLHNASVDRATASMPHPSTRPPTCCSRAPANGPANEARPTLHSMPPIPQPTRRWRRSRITANRQTRRSNAPSPV
jgi:hypothetical protein